MTANYEYSRSKKRSYRYKFKSNCLKNNKPFAWLYLNFHNLHEISNVLKNKSAWYIKYFPTYWVQKIYFFKWIRGLLSDNPLSQKKLFLISSEIFGLLVNMLTPNYEYSRSKKRIYCYKSKSNYLKNNKPFAWLYLNFHNLHEISNVLKKNHRHISSISEVIESEICAYLNG